MNGRRTGRVATWDDAAGYGTVQEDDPGDHGGTGEWFVHCTAIADGTRTIEQGAAVDFMLRAGHCGRWEATDIRSR